MKIHADIIFSWKISHSWNYYFSIFFMFRIFYCNMHVFINVYQKHQCIVERILNVHTYNIIQASKYYIKKNFTGILQCSSKVGHWYMWIFAKSRHGMTQHAPYWHYYKLLVLSLLEGRDGVLTFLKIARMILISKIDVHKFPGEASGPTIVSAHARMRWALPTSLQLVSLVKYAEL